MDTNTLKLLYDYIYYLRQNLFNLCCILRLSSEEYSILDSNLKTLLTDVDDYLFLTRQIDNLEGYFKFNPDGTLTKVSDLDIDCETVDINKPTK